jgi:hypothetical protein
MMLAMHGKPSEAEAFLYVLAERLHKTVAELRLLPNTELQGWQSYFTVKQALEKVAQ